VVSQCGLMTTPENPEHLVNAIVTLADNPALMAELGRRARAWAEAHLERDAILGRIFAPLHANETQTVAKSSPLPTPEEQAVTISE
jgi:colanic acid biosynthesis glycosyl transferase WcaI